MKSSDTRKCRILFFGEGVSLAHVGRPLVLAQALDPTQYEIAFATSHRYGPLVKEAGFSLFEVPTMSPDEFMKRLSKGTALYDYSTLAGYVNAERELIEAWKPDLEQISS